MRYDVPSRGASSASGQTDLLDRTDSGLTRWNSDAPTCLSGCTVKPLAAVNQEIAMFPIVVCPVLLAESIGW